MIFNDSAPIFVQISEYMINQILEGRWQEQQRIPSVRQLSAQLEVNPNTCMRAFSHLQEKELIFNKRGVGYFVSNNVHSILLKERMDELCNHDIPHMVKAAKKLGVTLEKWKEIWMDTNVD